MNKLDVFYKEKKVGTIVSENDLSVRALEMGVDINELSIGVESRKTRNINTIKYSHSVELETMMDNPTVAERDTWPVQVSWLNSYRKGGEYKSAVLPVLRLAVTGIMPDAQAAKISAAEQTDIDNLMNAIEIKSGGGGLMVAAAMFIKDKAKDEAKSADESTDFDALKEAEKAMVGDMKTRLAAFLSKG